jgi:tripartite-type tricarboxylate transporter receptor subunit TctC
MNVPRRQVLHLAAGAAALQAASHIAKAEGYPTRPVHIISGFAAGAGGDTIARLIGQILSERLSQQLIVENRTGAGGNIATEAVVKAPPDGYTLLLVTVANVVNTTLYERLSFNFARDISAVASIDRVPNVMVVHPSFPAQTVPAFIAYARANPGKINMASAGNGTAQHVAGEQFKMMAGINMTHVPYRGGAPALNDLLGGQVQVMFDTMQSSIGFIKAGALRPVAVTTATRADPLPNIPTVGEYLPGYENSSFHGLGAPKDTPTDIVNKINKEVNSSLADLKLKTRLAELGATPLSGSPADFEKLIADETDKWGKVVKFAGIKAE